MLKRSHYIAVGLVLALTLVILFLPAQTTARLKLAIGSLFLPLFGLAGASHQLAEKTGDTLTTRRELLKQNGTLREENQRLLVQSQQLNGLLRENALLRDQLHWQSQQKDWTLKLARVIARDPASWWRNAQINLGSRDGIRTNMPVLNTEGLIGRIASVGFDRSQVVLLGDAECKVAALVEDTHDAGVIGVSGPLDNSLVTLNCYSSKDANLKAGLKVVTSGLGGIFPKDILIGKIVDSRQVEYGLYTEARVKLAANLGALEEVWVLLP